MPAGSLGFGCRRFSKYLPPHLNLCSLAVLISGFVHEGTGTAGHSALVVAVTLNIFKDRTIKSNLYSYEWAVYKKILLNRFLW